MVKRVLAIEGTEGLSKRYNRIGVPKGKSVVVAAGNSLATKGRGRGKGGKGVGAGVGKGATATGASPDGTVNGTGIAK